MKKNRLFKHFRAMFCIFMILTLSTGLLTVSAGESTISDEASGELYLPSDDASADVPPALDAAMKSNKLTYPAYPAFSWETGN